MSQQPLAADRHRPARAYGAGLHAVTAVTLAVSYLAVVLGDTVRVTESGMGCASWPLCNGSAGLSGSYHALLEQSHRYLAATVTILVAATFAAAWRQARQDRLVFRSAAVAVGLIGVQVMLGAITVWLHNADWTVALHLAGAWLLVADMTVCMLAVWRAPVVADPQQPGARLAPAGRAGIIAAAALFALAVAGMLVLHSGASTACPGWPVCGRGTGPAGQVVLQYLHRLLGLAALVTIVAAAVLAWRSAAAGRAGRILAGAVLLLFAATAVVGAVVATTGATDMAQAVHLAVATALWIGVVALATPMAAAGAAAPAVTGDLATVGGLRENR